MKKIKKFAIVTLSLAAIATAVSCNNNELENTSSSNLSSSYEEVETSKDSLRIFNTNQTLTQEARADLIKKEYLLENNGYKDSDKVGIIVTLKNQSLLDRYNDNGYSKDYDTVSEYVESYYGQRQQKKIIDEQFNAIKNFQSLGYLKTVEHSYSTVLNGISFETEYGNVSKIEESDLVSRVVLVDSFNLPKTTESTTNTVTNLVDVYETGIFNSSTVKYDGDGTTVAVLDSGFDCTHEVFNDPAILNSIEKPIIDVNYISERLSLLNANNTTANLKPEDLYYSVKIPYAYDYADKDYDVNPADSEHGTHVAGIIGGSSETITGVATKTQLVLMKVFPDVTTGARTSDILAALEDATVLGVDAVNMSLGSSCGFDRECDNDFADDYEGSADGSVINKVYDGLSAAGITVVTAASNDYSSGYGGPKGNLNKVTNPDSGTVGSPSTYKDNLSVASISGVKTGYFLANDQYSFFFNQCTSISGKENDFVEQLMQQQPDLFADGKSVHEFKYIIVPGIGVEASYSGIGSQVKGKIALVKRGENTFEEKVRLAKKYGAIAIIIYNNVEGEIFMTVSAEGHIPAASVSKDVGAQLVSMANKGVGTIKISDQFVAGPFMSNFSSWGPTPSLALKPEITAHGGDILSSIPGGEYERMSGTSMASPNMCGIVVLIRQYVKETFPDLTTKEIEEMTNSLLMSTATIALNEDGNPYSPRKQGAGLASLTKATTTSAYIEVEGSVKPKLELGDDVNRTGVYDMEFIIKNVSDKELKYTMDIEAMTESVSLTDETFVSERSYMLDKSNLVVKVGNSVLSDKVVTVPANGNTKVTVTLTLSSEDKAYITKSFAYGMYVEGFVKAIANSETEVSLNVPFLAFFGDWTEAPIFDKTFFEVETEAHNNAIDADDKIAADYYATRPFGNYYYNYLLPLGTYLYSMDESQYEAIPGSEEHIAMTSKFGGINGISSVYAGCFRNCKEMRFTITDTVTGEVIFSEIDYNARKSFGNGGSAVPYYNFLKLRCEDLGLVNNRKYTFSMLGILDYSHEGEEEDEIGGQKTNVRNTFSFDFTMDDEAPIVKSASYYKKYDKTLKDYRYYLKVTVYDNHYVQAVTPVGFSGSNDYTLMSNYSIPVYGDFASETELEIEVTDYLKNLPADYKINNAIALSIDDYALNSNIFLIELPGTTDEFEFTEDGTDTNTLKSLSLTVGEAYDLTQLIYSSVSSDKEYFKYLTWSSSDSNIVEVHEGAVLAHKTGRAVITAYDKITNKSASITIQVKQPTTTNLNSIVYRKYEGEDKLESIKFDYFDTIFAYPIAAQSSAIGETGDRMYTTNKSFIEFYPGEKVKLHANIQPWYVADNYDFTYSSQNDNIASVDQDGVVTAKKEGKVIITLSSPSSTQQASITVVVKNEFVIENRMLVAYKGLGGDVVIPDDQGIYYIGEYAFCLYDTDIEVENPDNDDDFNKTPHSNTTIKSVTIPEGVQDIQKYAFYNCVALEKVILPSTIRYIREYAFANNTSLVEINLDDEVEVISHYCFYNCTSLNQDFKLNKCYTIGNSAFEGCSSLESINLSKLRNSGTNAFKNCTNLKNVTFNKDGLTKLNEGIFENTALVDLVLNVTQIPSRSFYNCDSLKTITINGKVVAIGNSAFAENDLLETVTINASVEYLNSYAFANCAKLTTVTLPNSAVKVEESIFSGSTSLETVNIQAKTYFTTLGSALLLNTKVSSFTVDSANETYSSNNGLLLSKDGKTVYLAAPNNTYGDYTLPEDVTSIAEAAFSGISNLTSLTFTHDVALANKAFANCPNLASVTLTNVDELPSYAFYGCSNLASLTNLDSVKVIGDYAFAETGLTNVTIGSNTTIGNYAFASSKLTSATLGENATIGDYAFTKCNQLKTVTLGENTTVNNHAFFLATSLATINSANIVGNVGDYAFAFTALTSIDLANASKLGNYSFFEASSLATVTLGDNVNEIGDYAFANKKSGSLTAINLPSSLLKIGEGAFMAQSKLTTITLPSSIKEVKANTFMNASLLTTVEGNIEVVSDYAFGNCTSLSNIDLSNVKTIGSFAFAKASKLQSVSLSQVVKIGEYAFYSSGVSGEVVAPALEVLNSYAFANSSLSSLTALKLKSIGQYVFNGTSIKKFTLASTLELVSDLAFNGANYLEEFNYDNNGTLATTGSVNNYLLLNDGVLYTTLTNTKLNLSSVPTAKKISNLVVLDGTASISESAGNSNVNIKSVVLPDSMKTVGAFAFYKCSNLASVEFKSVIAPSLECYKRSDIENKITINSPGYDKLHAFIGMYGLEIYYANFVDLIGTFKPISMILPSNEDIEGYDSIQYEVFFGTVENAQRSNYVAMNKTSVTYLESMDRIMNINIVSLQDETLINTASTAYVNLTDDLTKYGYTEAQLTQMSTKLAAVSKSLRELKYKTASAEVKNLQKELDELDTVFTLSRLTELTILANKINNLKPAEKTILDLTNLNTLKVSYQEYLDSLAPTIEGVDEVVSGSFNYLGVAVVALTTLTALAALALVKKF